MSKKNGKQSAQSVLASAPESEVSTTPRSEVAEALALDRSSLTKVLVKKPDIRTFDVRLVGLSPLMVHAWSHEAIEDLKNRGIQNAPKTKKRPARDFDKAFRGAMYKTPTGKHAFPAVAFKSAMVSSCRLVDGLTMTAARCMFIVLGDLVAIKAPEPTMDERIVRVSNGNPDVRVRPLYWPWETTISIRYNADSMTVEQLINMLVRAGEFIGVGELRPEKGAGTFGRFEVAMSSEAPATELPSMKGMRAHESVEA